MKIKQGLKNFFSKKDLEVQDVRVGSSKNSDTWTLQRKMICSKPLN
uniref:Uncharacterized protein n=1 Tax=Anguilla anguilla TaxID=7936 RepID=A0A0E9UY34_ANGAN